MRSSFLIAMVTALSALLVTTVAAAEQPYAEVEAKDAEDWELVRAGIFGRDTERTPAVVLGLKTVRAGRDPEMIGVLLFSRRPIISAAAPRPRSSSPLRIAPGRLNGVWVLIAEGRF